MQTTVSFKSAYAAIDHLLPPADAKHVDHSNPEAPAAQVAHEGAVLKGLDQLARSADAHAASEAVEVLMNVAALGSTRIALADRAVRVLSALHDDANVPPHLKSAIRQQALALRDYTQAVGRPAKPCSDGKGAAVEEPPAAAKVPGALPAALRFMAVQALQDGDAKALHDRFKADTEALRASYTEAAGHSPLRKARESASPRAVTPEAVERALAGLTQVRVIPRVFTLPQHSSPAERTTFEAAVWQLVSQGIEFEDGNDIDAPVRPGVLVLRVTGAPGQADRWMALLAVPSQDKAGQQDILLLHSKKEHPDVFSADLMAWLATALPGGVAHVAVAGFSRPEPMPDDGGLFLAHQSRQFDQALASDGAHAARKTGAAKSQLDEAVIDWCKKSRADQRAALATLPGMQDARGPGPVSPPLKPVPATAWWTRG